MVDVIVERCRRVREQLVEDLGGLDGLFRKLEAMDRQREESRAAVVNKRCRTEAGRKRQTRSSKPSPKSATPA